MSHSSAEPYRLDLEPAPSDADVQVVQGGLNAYNTAQAGTAKAQHLAAFVRDADGRVAGGAVGWTWGEVADVRLVWIRDDLRGQGYGRQLLQMVEAEATKRGCRVAVLDTYTFQAPEFYRKLGYESFGVIEGYPDQACKFFMRKQLGS